MIAAALVVIALILAIGVIMLGALAARLDRLGHNSLKLTQSNAIIASVQLAYLSNADDPMLVAEADSIKAQMLVMQAIENASRLKVEGNPEGEVS